MKFSFNIAPNERNKVANTHRVQKYYSGREEKISVLVAIVSLSSEVTVSATGIVGLPSLDWILTPGLCHVNSLVRATNGVPDEGRQMAITQAKKGGKRENE